MQCLIPGYVLPLSFDIPASCSRYTGYGIGRASCCIDQTSPFSPTEWREGSPPLLTLPLKQTGQVAPPGPKLLPSWAQSWADHSHSKQQNRLLSRLVWILHYIATTSTARGALCNRLLSLERALSAWKDHNNPQAPSSGKCLVKKNVTRTLLGHWSAVTAFQHKCWQWQSPNKFIPNTEEENRPRSLTFSYISLLPGGEHWCWQYPTRSPLKNNHTLLTSLLCAGALCRVDVSWQPTTAHKQNEGLITKQQIKALPSAHYPLGKRGMAIYWHSTLVM